MTCLLSRCSRVYSSFLFVYFPLFMQQHNLLVARACGSSISVCVNSFLPAGPMLPKCLCKARPCAIDFTYGCESKPFSHTWRGKKREKAIYKKKRTHIFENTKNNKIIQKKIYSALLFVPKRMTDKKEKRKTIYMGECSFLFHEKE